MDMNSKRVDMRNALPVSSFDGHVSYKALFVYALPPSPSRARLRLTDLDKIDSSGMLSVTELNPNQGYVLLNDGSKTVLRMAQDIGQEALVFADGRALNERTVSRLRILAL